jgi:UDP-N-acetyl-D-mannosaminuronic acid dehydrogenase/UDP-N-acetyl-D-glucosamine dehydrogenase
MGMLAVIGQGYVGLPLAMRAVEVGWTVVGVEVDTGRVARLAAGDSYVEDVPAARLRAALASGRYRPTTSYADAAEFDVAVITVPTPLREGNPDLSHIEEAGRALAPLLRPGVTVVLESTTYPGTTQELLQPLLEQGGLSAGRDFLLGYSPERIDPGNPQWGLVNTPKVVSGVDAPSLEAVQRFFDQIVEKTVPVSSPREAELAKLLENTFRHVNIALVNELAVFAHQLGIDIWEAIDAAATKPFGFMRFTPGPGVGGHCLPIDPSYLSWQVKRALGHSFRFVELANDVNDHMPDYVVQRTMLALNQKGLAVSGARLLLVGLAYKKNTGDARESPAARVAELLVGLGADVRVADPHVVEAHALVGVARVELTAAEVAEADGVLLLTDHDEFDLDLLAEAVVLDTRHVLPPRPGVEYL